MVFAKEDRELILLPIALEFEQKWDFAAIDGSAEMISEFVRSGFALMPGQDFLSPGTKQTAILSSTPPAGHGGMATIFPCGSGLSAVGPASSARIRSANI